MKPSLKISYNSIISYINRLTDVLYKESSLSSIIFVCVDFGKLLNNIECLPDKILDTGIPINYFLRNKYSGPVEMFLNNLKLWSTNNLMWSFLKDLAKQQEKYNRAENFKKFLNKRNNKNMSIGYK